MSCVLNGFVRPSSAIGDIRDAMKPRPMLIQPHGRKKKRKDKDKPPPSSGKKGPSEPDSKQRIRAAEAVSRSLRLTEDKEKVASSHANQSHGSTLSNTSGRVSRCASVPSTNSSQMRQKEMTEMETKMKDMRFFRDIHFSHPMSLGVCVEPPMFFPSKLAPGACDERLLYYDEKIKDLKKDMEHPRQTRKDEIKTTKWSEDATFTSESRAHYFWKLQSGLTQGILPFSAIGPLAPTTSSE